MLNAAASATNTRPQTSPAVKKKAPLANTQTRAAEAVKKKEGASAKDQKECLSEGQKEGKTKKKKVDASKKHVDLGDDEFSQEFALGLSLFGSAKSNTQPRAAPAASAPAAEAPAAETAGMYSR